MPNRREPPPPPPPPPPAVDSTALMERPDFGDDDDGGVGPGGFDDDDFTSKVPLERTMPPRDGERTGRFAMTEDGESLPSAHVSELQELDEFGGLEDLDDLDDLDGRAPTAIMRITPDMLREAHGESEDSEFAPPTSSELDGEIELQRWSAGSGASPARASQLPLPPPMAMDGNLEITDPTRRASGQAVTQVAVPLPPVPVLRADQIPHAPPPGATLALVDEADAALAAAHGAADATAARFYIQRARQVLARLRDQLD